MRLFAFAALFAAMTLPASALPQPPSASPGPAVLPPYPSRFSTSNITSNGLRTDGAVPVQNGFLNPLRLAPDGSVYTISRLPRNVTGDVGGLHAKTCAQPTVSTTAYSSGQDIGGVLNFGGASRLPLFPTVLDTATVMMQNTQTVPAFRLWLLSAYPFWSTISDHTALTIDSSDKFSFENYVNIPVGNLQSVGAFTLWSATGLNIPMFPANDTTMYGVLVATAAVTMPSTSGIQVCLTWSQD